MTGTKMLQNVKQKYIFIYIVQEPKLPKSFQHHISPFACTVANQQQIG